MGQALFTNNAFSLLASGISSSVTSLAVTGGEGALFPAPTGSDFFYVTLIDTSNNLEIVKCTARSTDTFTIVREQESTTGRAFVAGDRIELRLTAAGIVEADGYVGPINESSDTTCFPLFVQSATGSQLPNTVSSFTFNSSTGALVSTLYDGIIGSVTPAAGSFTTITGSGITSIDDTTDTTSGTSGSVHTDGGVGIAKKLYVGGTAKVVGVLTAGDDIVSDTDSTDDLGTTGVRWANLWVDAIAVTDNLIVGGNLTINGTLTTVATDNTVIKDLLIELGNGATGSAANDSGIVIERGDDANIFIGWDESADVVALATTSGTGATSGNLSLTDAQFTAAGATFSGTSSNLGTVTTIDINGGTIDGTAIGGAATAAGAFTTVNGTLGYFTTSLQLATGATVTGIEDSDTLNSNSATLLATQQSIKAYVDDLTPAAGIQMTWDTETDDTDEGPGTIKANNGTFASISVLYIDDVDTNSASINTFIDTLDDPTASNSAIIYLTKAGATSTAMKVFQVDGGVTSATTYSKVAVTGLVEVGSFSDGDTIGMVIAYSGDDGGGGTLDNIVEDTTPQYGGFLDTNSFFHSASQGANVASVAGDTNIWNAFDGNTIHITGTNAITDFGTPKQAGNMMWVIFDGAASVVDSATITVAGNANYQAAANDLALVYALTTSTFLFMPFPNSGASPVASDLVDDTSPQLGGDLDCNGAQIQWSKGADVASATALAVLTDGNYFDVTGTTTITSINTTGGAGTLIKLHFDGVVTLTHDSTDLILAGATNFTTEAGDELEFIEYASGDYRMTGWSLAGTAPGGGGGGAFLGEGASGSSVGNSGDIIRVNQQTLDTNQTMSATDNGSATGPFAIASGITLTIASGATFTVI
jgi:hypothetical protein